MNGCLTFVNFQDCRAGHSAEGVDGHTFKQTRVFRKGLCDHQCAQLLCRGNTMNLFHSIKVFHTRSRHSYGHALIFLNQVNYSYSSQWLWISCGWRDLTNPKLWGEILILSKIKQVQHNNTQDLFPNSFSVFRILAFCQSGYMLNLSTGCRVIIKINGGPEEVTVSSISLKPN